MIGASKAWRGALHFHFLSLRSFTQFELCTNDDSSTHTNSNIMSNFQNTQKTLEVKIRPATNQNILDRLDQKGASRVQLSREALHDLRLDSGQKCYLWKSQESPNTRIEATAWLTTEKNLSQKVIRMSKTFQNASGFKFEDDLIICAGNRMDIVETVILREISGETVGKEEHLPEISYTDFPHWEWYLGGYLSMSHTIFQALVTDIYRRR